MIHIIFGKSAEASLKFGLGKGNNHIIGLPIDYAIGPLRNIDQNNGIKDYFSWYRSTLDMAWCGDEGDQALYKQAVNELSKIDDGEQVIIWTCNNTSEQCGLRIVLCLLKDKNIMLSIINTSEALVAETRDKEIKAEVRHTGECSPEQLRGFSKKYAQPISTELRTCLEAEGATLLESNTLARTLKKGKIIHESEKKDDAFILACAHRELNQSTFSPVARLIGVVIGYSEDALSDAWIEYRIRQLICSGCLEKKDQKQMYKVKLPS